MSDINQQVSSEKTRVPFDRRTGVPPVREDSASRLSANDCGIQHSYSIGNVTFPAGIYFEWINGAWTARDSSQLKHFMPGPGPSIAEPKRSGKGADLPPGMSRAK